MNNEKLLNLGCGSHFHKDWVNVDFSSTAEGVIAHNLREGIPFADNEFDVVYHSHVLEHFSKAKAPNFLNECHRVLKPGGIIRIAIPDLEQIAKLYLKNLKKAAKGDKQAESDYDWIMLEMFDQMVRNKSGGEMLEYFKQDEIKNLDFVYKRVGYEAKNTIDYLQYLKRKAQSQKTAPPPLNPDEEDLYYKIGKFRLGGEVHQWMYDRFSLKRMLKNNGFKKIKVKTAYESDINNWGQYGLDIIDNNIRKPDSLFMEAVK